METEGERLKRLVAQAKRTANRPVKSLADHCGVSRPTIYEWYEKGIPERSRGCVCEWLSDALGVEITPRGIQYGLPEEITPPDEPAIAADIFMAAMEAAESIGVTLSREELGQILIHAYKPSVITHAVDRNLIAQLVRSYAR